ncbi:MAG TPA: type I-U CRISPR-associated protein Csx17 [Firmicutes bacterium]|nr:type I-U CRISPR-associated protein Csx17 [Bacillota bacterium]
MLKETLELKGCQTEPFSNYLKSLGVLRLVAEQKDPGVRGYWKDDTFCLQTSFKEDELLTFFRDEYKPTPILDPWNGGSGFWDKTTANDTLVKVAESNIPRLAPYREAIEGVWEVLKTLGLTKKPSKAEKLDILRLCRNHLSDSAVEWLDTAYALSSDKPRYAPILGTGGNDGKLDFANNFMQHVLRVIPEGINDTGKVKSANGQLQSIQQLKAAIYGGEAVLTDSAIGQFFPGGVGGPNGLQGFEAPSLVNSWDFIFMIEGALFFCGSVSRRLKASRQSTAAFPFTVAASAAGWGTLVESGESARAEIWLPIWKNPAAKDELSRLFAEARAEIGRRQVQDGTDFVRATANLGIDRGITHFYRYGFLRRSGKAHLTVPLGRVKVGENKEVDLLQNIDTWLTRFRRLAANDESTGSIKQAFRRIEQAIFAFCIQGGARNLQNVLRALGAAEQILAKSKKAQEMVPPLQGLSWDWVKACDDGSPEYRIAAALGSITHAELGAIRCDLEPVTLGKKRWAWRTENRNVLHEADLCRIMEAILKRRVIAGDKLNIESQDGNRMPKSKLPIDGVARANSSDIIAFLSGRVDDARILELLWGLCTVDWNKCRGKSPFPYSGEDEIGLSRLYAICKLAFWPGEIRLSSDSEPIVVNTEKAILNRLRLKDIDTAVRIAVRRLRSSGLRVIGSCHKGSFPQFIAGAEERRRMGAALLIPFIDSRVLTEMVIHKAKPKEMGGIAG